MNWGEGTLALIVLPQTRERDGGARHLFTSRKLSNVCGIAHRKL
jgi:hypothetical protein